jgi:hypothetical protein
MEKRALPTSKGVGCPSRERKALRVQKQEERHQARRRVPEQVPRVSGKNFEN